MKFKPIAIIVGLLFVFLIWKSPDSAASVARGFGNFVNSIGDFFVSLVHTGQ